MTSEGTFLLGLGAQKAGTSWLHHNLHRRNDADFGFCKEYHIHDALFLPQFSRFQPKRPMPWKWRTWRRARFLNRPERYFDYFLSLLKQRDIKLTGDITPSYACLEPQTLTWIRQELEHRNIAIRTVFVMRDPLDRWLSQHRMQLRKKGQLHPDAELDHFQALASKSMNSNRVSLRSDYTATLNALNRVFSPDQIFIGFYEQLFSEAEYSRLCAHLNVEYQEPLWEQRINASEITTNLPDSLMAQLGRCHAETYQSMVKQFPIIEANQLWPTAQRWCKS